MPRGKKKDNAVSDAARPGAGLVGRYAGILSSLIGVDIEGACHFITIHAHVSHMALGMVGVVSSSVEIDSDQAREHANIPANKGGAMLQCVGRYAAALCEP